MAEELRLDIVSVAHSKGLTDAARDLKNTRAEADRLGDSFDKSSDDAFDFNTEIEKTRTKVRELNDEFRRTGDRDVLKDLRGNRTILNDLERVRREAERLAPKQRGMLEALDFSNLVSEGRGMLITGGIGLGLAMAPAIAGIVSSAIVGAVGAGGVVGGALLAAQDTRVQTAWKALGTGILKDLEPAGAAFVQPVIHAADIFRTAFQQSGLIQMLEHAAVLVEPIAESVAGFVRELGPGLDAAVKGSMPTWNVLSRELPEFGKSLTSLFQSMEDVGPEAALAMHDFFDIMEDGTESMGPAIEGLTRVYTLTRGLNQSFKDMTGITPFGDIIPTFGLLEVMGKIIGSETVPTLSTVAQAQEEIRKKTEDATKEVEDYLKAWEDANKEFERAIDLQASYKLDVLDVEEGLQNLADTLDKNGNTLSQFTEEGRENQRAIIDVAKEMRQLRDDMISMGYTTESANATLEQNKQRLYAQAEAAGISKEKIDALVGALFAVQAISVSPIVVRTFNPNTGLEGRRAAGGPMWEGDWLVGESGPEVIRMGSGRSAYAWPSVGAYAGATGGGTRTPVVLSFASSGDPFLDAIVRQLQKYLRVNGLSPVFG